MSKIEIKIESGTFKCPYSTQADIANLANLPDGSVDVRCHALRNIWRSEHEGVTLCFGDFPVNKRVEISKALGNRVGGAHYDEHRNELYSKIERQCQGCPYLNPVNSRGTFQFSRADVEAVRKLTTALKS